MTLEDEHNRKMKLLGTYTAFVSAIFAGILLHGQGTAHIESVVILFSIAIPSLVALMLLDFIVHVNQARIGSATRGLAYAFGFIPSLAGISLVISTYSKMAAVCFISLNIFWLLAIANVLVKGEDDPKI